MWQRTGCSTQESTLSGSVDIKIRQKVFNKNITHLSYAYLENIFTYAECPILSGSY